MLKNWRSWSRNKAGKATRRARPERARARVETLEDRVVPAVFNVNSTADILNPPTGTVTLRSAIQAANATPGGNTINLTVAGTYRITLAGTPGEVDNAAGEFAISSAGGNLTIANTSGGTVTIDGNHFNRVFDINPLFTIGNIVVTNGGTGFTSAPTVVFTGGGGTGAAGTATVSGGMVTGVTITNPGSGYTSAPTISFTGGGGTGAAATAILTSPAITVTMQGFTIQNGIAQPGDEAAGTGGGIRTQGNASLTLTNMVVTNNLATADGGGVGVEETFSTPFTLTLNACTITNNHAGDAGGGIDTDGAGTVVINTGTVISGNTDINQGAGIYLDGITEGPISNIIVTNGGTGYTSAPTVVFTGGGGSGAAATATISGGVVTGITITNPGSGYLTAPTISFTGGGGTGAAAIANLTAESANLTITGTLISNNQALGTANGLGGGISNAGVGAVTIMNSTVSNNFAATTGGGFSDENNGSGTLTISNSVFVGNSSVGNGGGIFVSGPTTSITSSLIQGNFAGGAGGGLFASGVTLTIQRSTIAGNTSSGNGGGIEIQTTGTGMNASSITNATIANNTGLNNGGGNNGGGINAPSLFTGALTLLNDTINGNFATNGGGIFWAAAGTSSVAVKNTIIARNTAVTTGPDADNPAGMFTDNGGNLIGISGAGSGNTGFTAMTTQTGTVAMPLDPLLGVLQNNGGVTVGAPNSTMPLTTESLLTGSPALDKGINAGAPATDERGFNRIVNNTTDVGAYEFQPPATTTTLAVASTVTPPSVGQPVTLTATVAGTAPGSNNPLGMVNFFDGARMIGSATLMNGMATFTTSSLTPGTHHLKAVYAGLTVGDQVYTTSSSTTASQFISGGLFAVGGAPGHVQVRRASNGSLVLDFMPYGPNYNGPVSVAMGDITGDGFQELVTGATVGNPDVRVFDGKMLAQGTAMQIAQFFPYALQFNVGAYVAVGDINGDGFADLVTGASVGNPDVRVFNGKDIANGTFAPTGASLLAQWFPYALQFNVGVHVAVGDVSGNGFADIVTGPTIGNPDIRVYNGQDIAKNMFNPTGASQLVQFFPYGLNMNIGAFVAVGDTNGDGFADVITGSTQSADVRVFDGKAIAQGMFNVTTNQLDQFFAFSGTTGGVAVGAADFEGTGNFDILTGQASGMPHFRVVKGNATGTMPPAVNGIDITATDIMGGVNVGA